jgi:hypothetical protein
MRRVLDEFPDRVLLGEIYLPIKRLVAYYRRIGGYPASGGHSGQVSPIEPSASSIATIGLSAETPDGGILASEENATIAGMRIGAVPHPAVFLAFAKNRPRPSFDRMRRGRRSFVIRILSLLGSRLPGVDISRCPRQPY